MADGVYDGIFGDLGKGALKAVFDVLGKEVARRGAEAKSPFDYDGFDDIVNEALDTLAGVGGDRLGNAVVRLKALLSACPEVFNHPPYRAWIGESRSRILIKEIVREIYGAR